MQRELGLRPWDIDPELPRLVTVGQAADWHACMVAEARVRPTGGPLGTK